MWINLRLSFFILFSVILLGSILTQSLITTERASASADDVCSVVISPTTVTDNEPSNYTISVTNDSLITDVTSIRINTGLLTQNSVTTETFSEVSLNPALLDSGNLDTAETENLIFNLTLPEENYGSTSFSVEVNYSDESVTSCSGDTLITLPEEPIVECTPPWMEVSLGCYDPSPLTQRDIFIISLVLSILISYIIIREFRYHR